MYVNLIIDSATGQEDKLFTYAYYGEAEIAPGDRLVVPFGKGDKPTCALVYTILSEKPPFRCKEVIELLPKKYSFSKTQLYQIYLLRMHYASTYRTAYRTILPAPQEVLILKNYLVKTAGFLQLDLAQMLSEREMRKLLSKKQLKEALKKGDLEELISYDIRVVRSKLEYVSVLFEELEEALEEIRPSAVKQIRILKYAHSQGVVEYKKLCTACACTRQDVLSLCRKGLIRLDSVDKDVELNKYFHAKKRQGDLPALSQEQAKAFSVFTEHKKKADTPNGKAFRAIVNGVTGSGKTRLYFEMARQVLKEGKQVLFLLPEIALSLQVLSAIYSQLSERIAIIHTHVSDKDKAAYYQDIQSGRVDVILGVRSALFAPFKDLGMIIIDESHEKTYKSDQIPRFDAIHMAMELSEHLPCDIVLGSATTSLELFKSAQKRNYYVLKLEKRIGGVPLPELFLIDMKSCEKKTSQISDLLYEKLVETFEKGEQAMILHNRRGYSSYRQCSSCLHIETCMNCDLSLAVANKGGDLYCKYCDYKIPAYRSCSLCHEPVLDRIPAVKSVEEELKELFPNRRFASIDSDSTRASEEYLQTISDFESGRLDAILGTQVIAKGFDFDKVTMAAVINADQIFHSPDYSSAETAFNLMYQLAGRAGRRSTQGRVYIQCLDTEHRSLKYLLTNNFRGFLREEDKLRRMAIFPPYSKFVSIRVLSENNGIAREQARRINELLVSFVDKKKWKVNVYDFKEQYHLRIKNKYRYQILLKNYGEDQLKIVNLLYHVCVINKYKIIGKDVSVSLDFNPHVL